MLASLTLSFQQLASFALQLCRSEFQGAVFTIEFTTQLDEVVHFFFERQDEVVRHEGYTVSVGSQHYNARPFIGSMRGARAGDSTVTAEQDAAGVSATTLRSQQKRGSLQKCYLMRLAPSKICPHGMMQPTACLTQAKR